MQPDAGAVFRSPMRQKHVEVAVQVVIAESGGHRVSGSERVYAGAGGDIRERSVAFVRENE